MWLFTQYGFFSVVADLKKPGHVLIRARFRSHLVDLRKRFDKLLGGCTLINTRKRDYQFRFQVSKETWVRVAVQLAEEIEYGNFKLQVEQTLPEGYAKSKYMDWLHLVWSDGKAIQDRWMLPETPV